jgi:hypothetical protein
MARPQVVSDGCVPKMKNHYTLEVKSKTVDESNPNFTL